MIEENGILELHGSGSHGITVSDIDLDRDDGGAELGRPTYGPGMRHGVRSSVERCCEDILGIEVQSIVRDLLSANIAN